MDSHQTRSNDLIFEVMESSKPIDHCSYRNELHSVQDSTITLTIQTSIVKFYIPFYGFLKNQHHQTRCNDLMFEAGLLNQWATVDTQTMDNLSYTNQDMGYRSQD